jgi:hypothetical protein
MRSTHHTAWAYIKGGAATLVMVTGTALMMAAFSNIAPPRIEFPQDVLAPQVQLPADLGVTLNATATPG